MQQSVVAVRARSRAPEECAFRTRDGVQIFFRSWRGTGKTAVVLIHRGHEHSGRIAHLVDELDLPEVSFFAWDARAHGRSEGEQGPDTTMATFVDDLDQFVRHIRTHFEIAEQDIAIVGQSIGAVMAAAWVHDYAPQIRCMALAAPAFQVKLYVPFARLGLGIWQKLVGNFYVTSYVKGKALTHDPERIRTYHTDPLVKLRISVRVLLDLYKMSARLLSDAGAIRVPTQILLSGSDWVIKNGPPRQFLERLSTTQKEIHEFPGFYHDTLGEKDRHLPINKLRTFLTRQFDPKPSLRSADQSGFTRTEYDALLKPPFILHGIAFGLTRLFLNTIGRLSGGIRLGLTTGFDSGSSLDYVYRNQATGINPIGKLIDRIYLDSPGWTGIRVRKQMIEELIGIAMHRVRTVRIVDVAAGHGRYVLEAIAKSGIVPEDVLLRDFDPANVELGRKLIQEKGIAARFEQGDAFDRESLARLACDSPPHKQTAPQTQGLYPQAAPQLPTTTTEPPGGASGLSRFAPSELRPEASKSHSLFSPASPAARLTPRPTVAIVSGFFELFPNNDGVRNTLAGLASAIEPGGCLVYTGQPWHPQLEFIARTLNSHRNGAPWIMRRRTQEELDELVRDAGFRKVEQRIDPEGLFTVTLAERIE